MKRLVTKTVILSVVGLALVFGVFAEGANEQKAAPKQQITLKYWLQLPEGKLSQGFKSMKDTRLYEEMEKRTGIKIDFLHPPIGQTQAREQFNLIVASNDLPDIFEWDWINWFPGGPEKAVKDGVIVVLNDLIASSAPNYKKLLDGNADYMRQAKTDSGKITNFAFVRGDKELLVNWGPMMRGDWLQELGLKTPETVDDWYVVLKAFKEKKGCTAPFTMDYTRFVDGSNLFAGAFDVGITFYRDNNVIKYGPVEPAYKGFLSLLAKWYKEGLLDPDFAAQDSKALDAKVTTGKTGAIAVLQGGGMGKYLDLLYGKGTKFDLVPVPYPKLKAGDKLRFNKMNWDVNAQSAITPANKYPKETAKYLDYGYSPEGIMLFNFGIEGESYTMVNGKPTYTEKLTKPPKGVTMAMVMTNYVRVHWNAPFLQKNVAHSQFQTYQQQRDAVDIWAKAGDLSVQVPRIYPTAEETSRVAALLNQITTYQQEMFLKFIMGQEDLSKFDAYVAQLKKMGIDELLRIYNDGLKRYSSR